MTADAATHATPVGTPSGTRLMIVDDHEVVRMGLKAALEIEDDFTVVAEAGNGQEAIDRARVNRPDIILMDVRMDGMDGIEACREIRDEFPDTKVLMLTSFAEEETVVAALLAGAAGYVLKNVARARLLEALRSVARGETLLDSKVTRSVLEKLTSGAAAKQSDDHLTEREREVLVLIADGATNKEIAAKLVVSENTARNHVSHILSKLGFSRRSEAAAYAVRKGLAKDE
jgi:two-component system, NarL family, response regulator DevR